MVTHHGLQVRQAAPLNAEPRLDVLARSHITAADDFYIRTHGTIPRLDPAAFSVSVGGLVRNPATFSIATLRQRFPECRTVVTLQCAGNRRAELEDVAPVGGVIWEPGAIGTAEWTGVRLADVLAAAGCADSASYVHFDSCDRIVENGASFAYGASIALSKAMSDALLVYAMNGAPLSAEHGGPLRALVPGYYGARSVKWLAAIVVADRPSENYFQSVDYKVYPASADRDRLETADGITLNAVPVNAAVCEPAHGSRVAAGARTFRGYAIAGDRRVERVELSLDDGETWTLATLRPRRPLVVAAVAGDARACPRPRAGVRSRLGRGRANPTRKRSPPLESERVRQQCVASHRTRGRGRRREADRIARRMMPASKR